MQFFRYFLFVVLMVPGAIVKADTEKGYTMEAEVTVFHLARDLTGYAKNKLCPDCKEQMFKITPDVKATVDGKEVPLSRFVLSKDKPAFLVINKETNKLVGMKWFSK